MTQPYQLECTEQDAPLGVLFEGDLVPGGKRAAVAYTRREGHRLIVGPIGSGKFWAAICPLLLTADRASIVVYDVAGGEGARETAGHRSALGPVLILDPYCLQSDGRHALNPLELLGRDDSGILGRARELAGAIMIAKRGGDDDYWIGQAEDFLVALLIHVWTDPYETDRTLTRVRAIIRRPLTAGVKDAIERGIPPKVAEMFGVLTQMQANPAARNYVRDAAENIVEDKQTTDGRNAFYVQQQLRQNTSFLDDDNVQRVTASTTLDLRTLRDGVATLYVITPATQLKALGRWLRLVYSVLLPAMQHPIDAMRHDERNGTPLHIVLDEFPAFGPFGRVADDMATVRKFGVQFHIVTQKISFLVAHYGKGWETYLPRYLHVLGSDEHTTSQAVSQRIGTTLVDRMSTGQSRQMGGGSQSTNVTPTSQPFLAPHQISGMDENRCLVTMGGSDRPLTLRKWFAYQAPDLKALCRLPRVDSDAIRALPAPKPALTAYDPSRPFAPWVRS